MVTYIGRIDRHSVRSGIIPTLNLNWRNELLALLVQKKEQTI